MSLKLIILSILLTAVQMAKAGDSLPCTDASLLNLKEQLGLVKYSAPSGVVHHSTVIEALRAYFSSEQVKAEICNEIDCEEGFRRAVKDAYKCRLIDKITFNHLKRLDQRVDYMVDNLKLSEDEKVKRKYGNLPPFDDYTKKVNSINDQRKLKTDQAEIDPELEDKLTSLFYRKEKGIKKLSARESLYYRFSRMQINLLSSIFKSHIEIMNAQSGTIEIVKSNGEKVTVPINPEDMYRMSIRLLDLRIDEEGRNGILKGKGVQYGDLILAGLATGELDQEIVKTLITLPELREYHVTTGSKLKAIGMQLGRTALMVNPVTLPFATVGMIIIESIQRKKAYEKSMADKTHMF